MRTLTLLALAGCSGLTPNSNSRLHAEDDRQAVIGGEDAAPGQFPHQVSIRLGEEHICSGSFISSRFVLTSADCVAFYSPSALSLEGAMTRLGAGRRHSVDEVFIHPGYDAGTGEHDIALVRTWGNAHELEPIQLMSAAGSPDFTNIGDEAVISGWGAIVEQGRNQRDLQFASVLIQDPAICEATNHVETGDKICAGTADTFLNGGIGTCEGDQGGPLAIAVGSTWTQAGVVNAGSACASDTPLNTRVSSYESWILSHAEMAQFVHPGEPDDHGNSQADATVVPMDLQVNVGGEIWWGDTDVFALDLPDARDLTVHGTSDAFFDVRIFDQHGELIDWPTSFTFSNGTVTWELEAPRMAGTAYIEIKGSDPLERGHYSLAIEGTPIPDDEHGNTLGEATPIALDQIVDGYLNYEDIDVFSFETTQTVDVLIFTTGDTDTYGELFTDGLFVEWDHEGGDYGNFQFHVTLEPGLHHVSVEGRENTEDGVGAYDLQAMVVPSDVGDSLQTAAPLPLDVPTPGYVPTGDSDYFEITVPNDGYLQVGTSGDSATRGELYNSDGVLLAQNTGVDTAGNFFIVREVTAGQYFINVESHNGGGSGLYDVWATVVPELP